MVAGWWARAVWMRLRKDFHPDHRASCRATRLRIFIIKVMTRFTMLRGSCILSWGVEISKTRALGNASSESLMTAPRLGSRSVHGAWWTSPDPQVVAWWFSRSVVCDSFAAAGTVVHQAPLSMGFPKQEYWSGSPVSFSRGSSQPRDRTWVSCIGR